MMSCGVELFGREVQWSRLEARRSEQTRNGNTLKCKEMEMNRVDTKRKRIEERG